MASDLLKVGAQVQQVGEPLLGLGSGLMCSQAVVQFEFEEIAEPKGLSAVDLQLVVKKYGSYVKAAIAIGASEAFVRQNIKKL